MSILLVFPRPTGHDKAFAEAASRLAGAVAIVTWRSGEPHGLLVRAVSLLSTQPPRILFGAPKDAPGHDGLLGAADCAINLLSESDQDEAERFAKAGRTTRFPLDQWRIEADEPPRLRAGAAYLAGVIDHRIDAGSHSLFIVQVDAAEVNSRAPLVSFDHGFRRLAQPSGAISA
jgi:flavin reductase (DIM6/NTAB) family NADH-FMN oxidoreductase RutF